MRPLQATQRLLLVAVAAAVLTMLDSFSARVVAQQPTSGSAHEGGDIPSNFKVELAAFDHIRIEAMIPMRDGVKLNTIILIPKEPRGKLPIILTRTPYDAAKRMSARDTASPLMAMALPLDDEPLVRNGYIRAYQDVRGKHRSEGEYVVNLPLRGPLNKGAVDHSTDAWDGIDWLVKHVPDNNGKVGITGTSYEGFLTLMALFDPHPALAAAVPANPMVDVWIGDDWYHNGALRQTMIEWMYQQTSRKDASLKLPFGYYDMYSAFLEAGSAGDFSKLHGAQRLPVWRRVLDNPAYTSYWRNQAVHRQLAGIELRVPTLTVHGLFDQEDIYGPIAAYSALESKDVGNDRNYLAIGPWHHGQHGREGSALGKIRWHSDTSRHFREKLRQAFWDEHLKGIEPATPIPPVLAFETGANEWREYASWPPQRAGRVQHRQSRLYLRAEGSLGFASPPGDGGHTEFVSDPVKPVPYRVRPILRDTAAESSWRIWLGDDQRPFSDRTDVLTFVSDALKAPVTICGAVNATLFASTTGADADWVVKLIDVFPHEYPSQPELGGYQLMISADILRGRYRETFEEARPLAAGKVLAYRLAMPHAHHTFDAGHRFMVQVQSSWFPLYDRNPQTFVRNIAWARPEDYQRATHSIHHSSNAASVIELPICEPAAASSRVELN